MRTYLPTVIEHAEDLCDALDGSKGDVEVHKLLTASTFCVISKIGFGVELGSIHEVIMSPLMELGGHLLAGQVAMITTPVPIVKILRALPRSWMPESQRQMFAARDVYTTQARDVYQAHAQSQPAECAPDQVQSLLEALARARLPFEEARDEIITLMIAGHETTANTLSWALYLLALNPSAQRAARDEVASLCAPDQALSLDDLGKLALVRGVFLEALRLYSTVPMVARSCERDARVGAYVVPKGSTLVYSITAAALDNQAFSGADAFDPWRHTTKAVDAAAWHPFGPTGPRKCMGYRLADIEAVAYLATILRRFEIEPASAGAPEPVGYTDATLGPKESGLYLRFRASTAVREMAPVSSDAPRTAFEWPGARNAPSAAAA